MTLGEPEMVAVADIDAAQRWSLRERLATTARGRGVTVVRVSFLVCVLGLLYGPMVLLVVFSFNDSIVIALPFKGLTTRWYGEAMRNELLVDSLRNSLGVAAIVTPICLVLGTLAAFGTVRFRYRLRGAVAGLVGAPLVVPWLVIGVGALLFFVRLNVPLSLRTIAIMHVVCTFPLVAAIVSARLVRFDPSLEEAAQDLGATRMEVLRYIVVPQLAPTLGAAAIFAFSWSFNNFAISFFTGGFELTFPVWVYSTLRHAQNLPTVNAISTVVSAIQIVLVVLAWRLFTSRSTKRGQGTEELVEFMG